MCTYGERTGSVSGGRPAGTPVQTHTLIRDDLKQTTTTEGLRVCLTLNLQDVQGEQDDLSNTDQTKARESVQSFFSPIPTEPQTVILTCQQWRA